MDELLNAEHLLMQEVMKDADMQSLVNISAKLLGNPVAFHLLSLTELVCSDDFPKEVIEDFVNCRIRSTKEEITKWTETFKASITNCKPVLQSWPYMRYRHLVCGSGLRGSLVGYITMPQIEYPLEEINPRLVELIAKTYGIALIMNEESHIKSSEHSILRGLLTDTINSDYLNRNILFPSFGDLEKYRMLWFLRNTSDGKLINDQCVSELLYGLNYKLNILFEEGYAVLTDGNDDEHWEQISAAAANRNILIGISDAFYNITNTKKNFTNAQYALHYAAMAGKTSGIAKFDDFKLFHLASLVNDNQDLSEYMMNRIREIEQYDIKNNSEYLNTLRVYLHYNKNVGDMAEALFIHKNTVLYRIKRLQELFHIDFHDCSQLASLVCSLIIYDNHKLY